MGYVLSVVLILNVCHSGGTWWPDPPGLVVLGIIVVFEVMLVEGIVRVARLVSRGWHPLFVVFFRVGWYLGSPFLIFVGLSELGLELIGAIILFFPMVIDREAFSQWHYKADPTHVCFFALETFVWLAQRWRAELAVAGKDVVVFTKPTS